MEGPRRRFAGALAVREPAFRVKQDGPARGQCGLGVLQRLCGPRVVTVNRM